MLPAESGPSIADAVDHALDPAWIELQRVVGWISWAVLAPLLLIGLLISLVVGSLSAELRVLAAIGCLALVLLLAWLAHKWPPIEYRYFRYALDAQQIQIRHGVVWRTITIVPRSRVQHIDVAQGPIERRYGLATLSIYTAGTEYARVDLPGLPYSRAVQIRDHLLPGHEHAADDGT